MYDFTYELQKHDEYLTGEHWPAYAAAAHKRHCKDMLVYEAEFMHEDPKRARMIEAEWSEDDCAKWFEL